MIVFNSFTSAIGSPGSVRSPTTVHRTRIFSPNNASFASLTASVAILDSHRSLGYFESTLETEVRFSSAFAISEESNTFLFVFLNGNGSGSEPDGVGAADWVGGTGGWCTGVGEADWVGGAAG